MLTICIIQTKKKILENNIKRIIKRKNYKNNIYVIIENMKIIECELFL